MNNKLIIGILVGFGAFYLFEKIGKKPCSCKDVNKSDLAVEALDTDSEEMSCEEAVALVMAERRKTSRLSEQGFASMEKAELEKCRSMQKT